MSLNSINDFSFENVQYGDFVSVTVFDSRFMPDSSRKRCDYARTGLMVSHSPGTHIPRYRWEHREIWFYTNNENQVLDIGIDSPQSMSDGEARFHLHRIDANESEWIRHVQHKLDANSDWISLDDIADHVPPHTRFIRLHLAASRRENPHEFQVVRVCEGPRLQEQGNQLRSAGRQRSSLRKWPHRQPTLICRSKPRSERPSRILYRPTRRVIPEAYCGEATTIHRER